MRNIFLPILVSLFSLSLAASAITVSVSSPTYNQNASSPLHLVASASSNSQITGWHVYADGVMVYTGPALAKIDDYFAVSPGYHQLVIRAWDYTGNYASQTINANVTNDGLPIPPNNALVFGSIENRGNWSWCHDSGCAGGSGRGTYWMAQYQRSPSLDGSSMQFYNSGAWANALWWQKMGSNNSARNFLWDFFFYVDSNSVIAAQAIEFDAFQFISGYNYMMGTQCNYGPGVWDTWDELSGQWLHTSLACPKFAPNTWHHLQLYTQTMPSWHQYKYVTLVVDGKSAPLNIVRNARNLSWSDNMGVQWQLDVNNTGIGFNEWVDKAKLTVW